MKHLLKKNGQISILDYNHEDIDWVSKPPTSMRTFYNSFLKWRADAGMNNRIAEDLPAMLKTAGFESVETINSDEFYHRKRPDFGHRVGIWSKVAGSTQMVEEGYIDNATRLQAIEDYNQWVEQEAVSMTMKLNEVRGINSSLSTEISSDDALSKLVRSKGISTWEELLHCVQNLPYGRNSTRGDFLLVLNEGKGSCSSKHAFLKKVAEENDIPKIQLILGLYKMNQRNTPGIGSVLANNALPYLPEAHCYLKIDGKRFDLTTRNASFDRIRDAVITEIEIEPEQVIDDKSSYHRDFLKNWIAAEQLPFSFDEIWAIREECIQNLSA